MAYEKRKYTPRFPETTVTEQPYEYNFDAATHKAAIVRWIQNWFAENGPDCNAVIGISGGKDSSIVAALCVEALGKERVIGVMLPNGTQKDIKDARTVCKHLGINRIEFNISGATRALLDSMKLVNVHTPHAGIQKIDISKQTKMNLPPRIRMTALYAVAQSMNGRVANTCNLSESMIGWETKWGDAVGDFSPIADLTKTEVVQIGLLCDLPKELVLKAPADGLCGKTDEDAFGFTYEELDFCLRTGMGEAQTYQKVLDKINSSRFKRRPIAKYKSGLMMLMPDI